MSQCKRLRKSELEKPSVNENKEYYQHQYVDAYAENMILCRVNDDCLAEIFMYLSPIERPKVALVCKKWKQVLDYSWINVTKLELTQWNYDKCPSYINKYPTMDGLFLRKDPLFRFLKPLLGKCGRYLKELDLTAYGSSNIVPVISKSCKNLVKLRLRFNYSMGEFDAHIFEHLSKLKVLKIIFQHVKPDYNENHFYIPISFNYLLKNIAGTLTELSLSNWVEGTVQSCECLKKISYVIPELKALKTLEIAGIKIDSNLSMYLENSQILVINHNDLYERWICPVRPYKYIMGLNLSSLQITNDCLYNIANCMEQLQSLKALCERVTDSGIIAISKMNNLFNLDLMGHSDITESSIKLLKNFIILLLPYSNKITDYSVTKILENSPNIKEFHIRGSAITSKFIKKAAEISRNRQIKLKLGIQPTIPTGIEQYESPYLEIFIPDCEFTSFRIPRIH